MLSKIVKYVGAPFLVVLSLSCTASAWLFQPPPGSVPEEELQRFREASVLVLNAISDIYDGFAEAESDERGFSEVEVFILARRNLDLAAGLFSGLSVERFSELGLPREVLSQFGEEANRVIEAYSVENGRDVIRISADFCIGMSMSLAFLLELGFSPTNAQDVRNRDTVNELSRFMSDFSTLINTASGAWALQFN